MSAIKSRYLHTSGKFRKETNANHKFRPLRGQFQKNPVILDFPPKKRLQKWVELQNENMKNSARVDLPGGKIPQGRPQRTAFHRFCDARDARRWASRWNRHMARSVAPSCCSFECIRHGVHGVHIRKVKRIIYTVNTARIFSPR